MAEIGGIFWLLYLGFLVFVIIGMWKVFEKAGEPGWAAIVPIYNIFVLLKIAGKPAWWVLLYFIPVVNVIAAILVCLAVAKCFGKSDLYGIGLFFLGVIFFPMLGFGAATYTKPVA